jgi:hypothetical protein
MPYAFFGSAICLFCLATAFQNSAGGQKIEFTNPSFEDTPRANASPAGWGSNTPNSTPDILPGAWGLQCKPKDGRTCIGLVTREDGTREDFGQLLKSPLQKDICYTFSIYLAHLPKYVGHNQPIRLRIWGGSSKGAKEQLLDSSELVDHEDWKLYKFQFTPAKELRYISFEAYFGPGVLFKYKGNILLDQCSAIERCDRA